MDDLSLDQLSGLPLVSPIWQQEKALAVTARASFCQTNPKRKRAGFSLRGESYAVAFLKLAAALSQFTTFHHVST